MIKFGILLIVSYVSRTSALPPCVCARNYQPVCGSDGHTYPNSCMLDCATLTNADLKMTHPGDCSQPLDTCICTYEYKPVCGIDGTTYPNQCSLGCEKARNPVLEKKYDGPCRSADLIAEELKVAEVPNQPPCVCTRDMHPVCGTDGVTYNSPCLLQCAAQNKPLAQKADGPCDGVSVKVVEQPQPGNSCVCTRNYKPVCGSDGTTYANPCLLGCKSNSEPELRMLHDGPC